VCVTFGTSVGRKARKFAGISSWDRTRFEGIDDLNGAAEISGDIFSLRAQNSHGGPKKTGGTLEEKN
jgi:hypothetical protein